MAKTIIMFLFVIFVSATQAWADPIVVIVNKKNPTSSLSAGDVRRFFLLETKDWPSGGKIKPINRNKDSSPKKAFIGSVLNMSQQDYNQHWISVKQKTGETEPKTVKSNKFVLKIVGKNPHAVGYLPAKYFNNLEAASKGKIKVVFKAN